MGEIYLTEIKVRFNTEIEDEGLVGWASFVVNGAIFLDSISIRRGHDEGLYLAFPYAKPGGKFFYFNPINGEAMDIFRDAILSKVAV